MKKNLFLALGLLVAGASVLSAIDDVPGQLKLVGDKTAKGLITWQSVKKQYLLTVSENGTSVMHPIPLAQVVDIRVQKPAGWDDLLAEIRQGKNASAVPKLEKIASEYTMLYYDRIATFYLLDIYLKSNRAEDAMKAADRLIAADPRNASVGDAAPLVWEAMLATGKTTRLDRYLDEAVKNGSREVSAKALVARGDLYRKTDAKKALVDGYLRVVALYGDVKSMQPAALAKAAEAFDTLQQVQYAEKMRQKLLTNFSDSPEAKKLRGN